MDSHSDLEPLGIRESLFGEMRRLMGLKGLVERIEKLLVLLLTRHLDL